VGTLYHFPSLKVAEEKAGTFKVRIPWYLWGFIICGLIFAFVSALAPYVYSVNLAASMIWTVAMVSVGLTVDIKEVFGSLGKPLLVGLAAWLGLLGVFIYTYVNTL
jgi:uncharacterized membrane protein YadS